MYSFINKLTGINH